MAARDIEKLISRYLSPENTAGAKKLQQEARKKVRIVSLKRMPKTIAGLDVSYKGGRARGAAVLYSYPELELLEESSVEVEVAFPYVPGYLTFREGPALVRALARLSQRPDILLFDGQGIAHPSGMGVASHIGALLNIPGIGCAKSRLVGAYREPGVSRGSRARLVHKGKEVGAVLRTRRGVKPLFVSPGHRVDLEGAVDIVLRSCGRYRSPEPLRGAHGIAGKWRGRAAG